MAFLCVWVFSLYACLCSMCVPGASGGQKMVSDIFELKLQMAVSFHMGAGNRTFWKKNQCSYHSAISSTPHYDISSKVCFCDSTSSTPSCGFYALPVAASWILFLFMSHCLSPTLILPHHPVFGLCFGFSGYTRIYTC